MIALNKIVYILFKAIFFIIDDLQMLPCISKQILNITCPGCGLQRSVLLLFYKEFYKAFLMYPAIYFLLILLILIFLKTIFKKLKIQKSINIIAILTISTIFINYIIKLIL